MNNYSEISVDGLVLPNKRLTNLKLIDAVEEMSIPNFIGTFRRDRLPQTSRQDECGMLNLVDAGGDGTHWAAWHRNKNDKFHFDSFGVQPLKE